MKRIFIAALFLSLFSCKGKPKFFGVSNVCDGLYREKYRVFSGGAWSAEKYEDYLTDSTNFRLYIGVHDEYGSYDYDCVGDTIIVRKYSHGEEGRKLTETKNLSLTTLKQEHEFKDVVARWMRTTMGLALWRGTDNAASTSPAHRLRSQLDE